MENSELEEIKNPNQLEGEVEVEKIRPSHLSSFVGQERIKKSLNVYIDAAKKRSQSLDHTLFYGQPGLGKTTLSLIIARELGVNIKVTSGPMISKTGELAALLTNIQEKDVLFIDEIHRLNSSVEEVLYSAMEDFRLDLIIGEGPAARTIKIDLPQFTLVGATTRMGLISNPLKSRFGIVLPLELYTKNELILVIERFVKVSNLSIHPDASAMIADRSRGTPRIAIRVTKRVNDFALFSATEIITSGIVEKACQHMGIDSFGLDSVDIKYMRFIAENYSGGPVGIETISAGLSEDKDSIEDNIEPFLLQSGFIERTQRGRVLTDKAFLHLGLKRKEKDNQGDELF